MWKDFDAAFRAAVRGADVTVWGQRFYKRPKTATVCLELQSGRILYYRQAGVRKHARIEGEQELCAVFGKSDIAVGLHGGSLTENVVQALARDLLVNSLQALAVVPRVYPVLHVYDEIVCEVRTATAKKDAALIARLMTSAPKWAASLPLAVEQKICERWTK